MSGRKRHYIPASYISQFSSDKEAPALRERKVWVLRRGKTDITQEKAENVAYVKNLYGYGSDRVLGHCPNAHEDCDNEGEALRLMHETGCVLALTRRN